MEDSYILNHLIPLLFWEALGAIGEWVGGLAAAAAVWWAVYQTKSFTNPRVKTTFDILSTKPSGDILILYAINSSQRKIIFTFFGIRWAGSNDYLISRVYNNPDKEPVDSYDNIRFMVSVRDLQIKCLEAEFAGIKELVYEFKDAQHKIYHGQFMFNVESMEVEGAKKINFQ